MWNRFLYFVLVLMVVVPSLFADIITLVDKRVLHVKVLGGDENGVNVERLDNGGRLYIRWNLISETDRKFWRQQLGLEEDESEADLLMDAHRIVLKSGDYHDGLVQQETQTELTFRTNRGETIYPRAAIAEIQERKVSIFEVFSAEELYAQKAETPKPDELSEIDHQFELARWASRVTIYDKAIEHYDRVKEINPEYKADYIANQLKLLDVLDKQKEIRAAMKKAAQAGYAKDFSTCYAIYDEVLGAPDITKELRMEVEEQKKKFIKRREDYYSRLVVESYPKEVRKRIDALARNRDIYSTDEEKAYTIDKALTYLRTELHKEIVAALAEKHSLDPKNEVETWWKDRKNRATQAASYNTGTFVVAGDKEVGSGDNGGANQVARQFEQLARAFNRQNQQQPQQQARVQLETKDQWWRKVDSTQRAFFLRAWYAENGGQFTVVRKYDRPCENCGATGTTKETGQQGTIVRQTCTRCHGNKGDRVIEYR